MGIAAIDAQLGGTVDDPPGLRAHATSTRDEIRLLWNGMSAGADGSALDEIDGDLLALRPLVVISSFLQGTRRAEDVPGAAEVIAAAVDHVAANLERAGQVPAEGVEHIVGLTSPVGADRLALSAERRVELVRSALAVLDDPTVEGHRQHLALVMGLADLLSSSAVSVEVHEMMERAGEHLGPAIRSGDDDLLVGFIIWRVGAALNLGTVLRREVEARYDAAVAGVLLATRSDHRDDAAQCAYLAAEMATALGRPHLAVSWHQVVLAHVDEGGWAAPAYADLRVGALADGEHARMQLDRARSRG